MSGITGEKRVQQNFSKKVGLLEAKVIAINPTEEDYKEVLGLELKEDSKATEYLGTNEHGNDFLRVDVWVEDVKTSKSESPERYKLVFFLENKERENKDLTKKQYINNIGASTWTDDTNNLPDWFKEREYRVAFTGEEELYAFLRTWLSKLDYKKDATILELEWKKLMKGNVKDLQDQVNGEWCDTVGIMATVVTKEKNGEVKEYQAIYNKAFFPAYSLKNFRLIDYSSPEIIASLKVKKTKDLKPHERFVLSVLSEYGCKDFFVLKDLKEYDPNDNLVASDKPISKSGSDY